MLVTAYKDPVTGSIFESEAALADFQAKDGARQKLEKDAAETSAHYYALLRQMETNVADVRELAAHFKGIYEAWFPMTFAGEVQHRKRAVRKDLVQPVVDSVELDDIELLGPEGKGGPMRLRLEVIVTVTGDLDWYEAQGYDWAPDRVLAPFRFTGSGNTHHGAVRKQVRRRSGLVIDVPKLPKFAKTVETFSNLMMKAETRQFEVDAQLDQAEKADAEVQRLQSEVKKAREVLRAAEQALNEVDHALEVRKVALGNEVSAKHPFEQEEELRTVTQAVGTLTTSAVFHIGLTYQLKQ